MQSRSISTSLALLTFLFVSSTRANVTLPGIFGDHMVLQANEKITVWGAADPGEDVAVSIAGAQRNAVADKGGNWMVTFDPIRSDRPVTLNVKGKNEITLQDVLIGELWLCAGQSNMGRPVSDSVNGKDEIAKATYPNIRLFQVKLLVSTEPQPTTVGKWEVCSPQTVGSFSAVAYYFGRHLHQRLNVPVGLIVTARSSSPGEGWMDRASLQTTPALRKILADYDANLAGLPQRQAEWQKKVQELKSAAAATRPSFDPAHPDIPLPEEPRRADHHWPTNLYYGMINPLVGLRIEGVIWYQGESNVEHPAQAEQYRGLLTALIDSWRGDWSAFNPANPSAGDFAFLIVQLPNFKVIARPGAPPAEQGRWAVLREAQADVAAHVARVGIAVTIDVGEAGNVHPKNKQDVGRRLGLQAEKIVYGRDVIADGPTFKSAQIRGSDMSIKFDHVADGLKIKGDQLNGFELAGDDRQWHAANATIIGANSIVVLSKAVKSPKFVRYAWADNPTCNLFNSADLPAMPFRTDRDLSR